MSSAATHLHPADPADQQAEDAQYYRQVLHELIDMGMGLARAVHQQGIAEDGAVGPAAAAGFDRISRAVRRTVALARKVAEPLPAREPGIDRVAVRRRILREVEDVIQRSVGGVDAEALRAELSERLDAPELEDEIDDRPVAEIIADICRDLGLMSMPGNHPWKRRTPGDLAALRARAAQPRAAASSVAPPLVAAHAAPGCGEDGAGPRPFSREGGMDLLHRLHLTPPVRGP